MTSVGLSPPHSQVIVVMTDLVHEMTMMMMMMMMMITTMRCVYFWRGNLFWREKIRYASLWNRFQVCVGAMMR